MKRHVKTFDGHLRLAHIVCALMFLAPFIKGQNIEWLTVLEDKSQNIGFDVDPNGNIFLACTLAYSDNYVSVVELNPQGEIVSKTDTAFNKFRYKFIPYHCSPVDENLLISYSVFGDYMYLDRATLDTVFIGRFVPDSVEQIWKYDHRFDHHHVFRLFVEWPEFLGPTHVIHNAVSGTSLYLDLDGFANAKFISLDEFYTYSGLSDSVFIARRNSTLDTLWMVGFEPGKLLSLDITKISDSRLIFHGGYHDSTSTLKKIGYVSCRNADDGSEIWTSFPTPPTPEYGADVVRKLNHIAPLPNGYILCVGFDGAYGRSPSGDIWFVLLDSDGNIVWNTEKHIEGLADIVYDLRITSDENVILMGHTDIDDTHMDRCFIMKLNPFLSGLEEIHANAEFKLFPNPAKDELHISGTTLEKYSLLIHSLEGKLMDINTNLDGDSSVNVNNLPAGTYTLTLFDDKNYIQQQFIKL